MAYIEKLHIHSKQGTYEYNMLKDADEPELQSVWLEAFLEKQSCLDCDSKLDGNGVCLICNPELNN